MCVEQKSAVVKFKWYMFTSGSDDPLVQVKWVRFCPVLSRDSLVGIMSKIIRFPQNGYSTNLCKKSETTGENASIFIIVNLDHKTSHKGLLKKKKKTFT